MITVIIFQKCFCQNWKLKYLKVIKTQVGALLQQIAMGGIKVGFVPNSKNLQFSRL